jgi:transketolase
MRKAFIQTLEHLAEKDKDIYLLTGDLGFSVFEEFAKKFPKRFINCGLTEQSMASIAAGLALAGKKPYIYSIVPFVTMRCFEQIRNDICLQNLNLKIVGVGTGLAYGALGATHYAIEDISIFRPLPNICIFSPGDSVETEQIILQSYKNKLPAYIRLDKTENFLADPKIKIKISEPNTILNGADGLILSTGACLKEALTAAQKLKNKKYFFEVASMHTLKPINERVLVKKIRGKKYVFTIEEHKKIGGLGSIIGEIIAEFGIKNTVFKTFSLPVNSEYLIGHQSFLRKKYGIDANSLHNKILKILKNEK